MDTKKWLPLVLLVLALVACTTPETAPETTVDTVIIPTPISEPTVPNLFSSISRTRGVMTVSAGDIELVPASRKEIIRIVGAEAAAYIPDGTYILTSTDSDGCGPSRLEMINAAKDEAARQGVPWNKLGSLLLVESGFNAMRKQNGNCETIVNPKSGATCMGQFLYAYHSHRNWNLLVNSSGSYEGHIWCLNQTAAYLIEEANGGLGANANAWAGWDSYWDGGIWRYKGCWHPAAHRADGTTDCDVFHGAEIKGGFIDEASGVYVSLEHDAINTCWNFDENNPQWVVINRGQGQTCMDFNKTMLDRVNTNG